MKVPTRPRLPLDLPEGVLRYICDLEDIAVQKKSKELEKKYTKLANNNSRYRNRISALVLSNTGYVNEIRELRAEVKSLSGEVSRKQPSSIDYVLKPTDFFIKQTTYDLLKFDVFESRILKPRNIRDLHMTIKCAKFFLNEDCKYDLVTVMILLFAWPLEQFKVADLIDLTSDVVGAEGCRKRIRKLERYKYIDYNIIKKVDIGKDRFYYITDKGRAAVDEFLKDYRQVKININFYERNFRRAYYKAEKPSREKLGFAKQYRVIYGESFQSEFARAKSIDSYSRKRKRTQPSEPEIGG